MDKPFRRYEMLLPLRFNYGQPVPDELIAETLLEPRERFGAVSCESQTIQGQWEHHQQVFRDNLVRVFVDVFDEEKNRRFFVEFKEQLKSRFKQIDIWMTTYPLDVI
jgi:hypothetical protein